MNINEIMSSLEEIERGEHILIYYHVVSCVNGRTGTVFQAYATKSSATKNAYKRFDSGCYNCVYVLVEDTEKPKNNKMLLDLRRA